MAKPTVLALLLFCSLGASSESIRTEEIEFISRGDRLAGSLVLPASNGIRAAVVFVHGSGPQTRNLAWAERFAKDGIAALVYDKRGAGRSGGKYEEAQSVGERNLVLLADDAAAAVTALSRHPALKTTPLGLTGISQAGWIVPLAARKNPAVRFIVLWSGPVCRVSEEDIYSKYTRDADGGKVPSYSQALSARKQKYIWPDFLGKDTDPSESLAGLAIPGLWIFGGQDGSVPVDLSVQRLKALQTAGGAYEHVVFPGLGHNNMPETFATATDWIRRTARGQK